jgi:predicted O-linked N-acetylglucosamine transferase (SPINDLY family)
MDLHRQGRLQEAETVYRGVLAAAPRQFEALHLLGILKLQQGNLSEALALISEAVEINPSSLDARSNLVAVLLNLERPAEAIEHCNKVLAVSPMEAGAHYNRGIALTQLKQYDEALASFDKVLAIKSDHVNALFNRASVLASLRRYDDAITGYDRLLALVPRHADALNNKGMMLVRLGRDAEAAASFDQALAVAPDHVHALTNRGIALKRRMRHRDALASFDRALALKPDHVEAHVNRGNVLLDLYRPDEAIECFKRALALVPAQADALTNLAIALRGLGRYQDALQCCEQALASEPQYDNAFLVRGHALAKFDRPDEAAASYERALGINPSNQYAFGASLMAHRAACNWDRVAELLPAVERSVAAGAAVIPPFCLLGLPLDPAVQLQCAKNFTRQRLPAESTRFPQHPPAQSGKIRLAYLSGDFRRHPVAYLMADLIERHDRSRFEVIGISYGMDDGSEERTRLTAAFDQFHDVQLQDDQQAGSLINDLQVEIAIDLGGHTENSRSGILQARPAPVQVNYLGFAATMGAEFVDYIIADKVVLPFDQQPFYSEKIVHLPDSFLANDATRPIAPHPLPRERAGLPERAFVFCCFNNSFKISAEIFQVWLRLLGRVEGSVLWLSQQVPSAAATLRAAARAGGIDPDRIVFAPRLPSMAEHLARHRLADLFLDTPGYNAHTTASDALWAGLPVVTCAGTTFAGRVAASLLHSVGLPQLVTGTLADYEALALKLAGDPDALADARRTLGQNRLSYPLFDSDRFRRHIEQAYLTMLDIARENQGPRSFSVEPGEA